MRFATLAEIAAAWALLSVATARADPTAPTAPSVSLPDLGTALGTSLTSFHGRPFSAFLSLPYAHPITKEKRYQYTTIWNDAPWPEEGTYDASRFRARCPQASMLGEFSSGSEDCLHISVYTPLLDLSETTEGLPVMVFIHGGGYYEGEATLYMPSKLMDRDVVVAVVQYRLGTFGFLYSETTDAPGNMGLHDQILAIRWVKQYISHFGGNPDLVTVFGQSAGGASTSLLMTSPLMFPENNGNQDLVQHFIPMSGSCLEYWTIDHDFKENFIKQADAAGCQSGDNAERVECMRDKSVETLVMAAAAVSAADTKAGGLGFAGQIPVVQSSLLEAEGVELVLAEPPLEAVTGGRYLQRPVMMGSVRDEGSMVMGIVYTDYLKENQLENDTNFLEFGLLPMISRSFGIDDDTNSVANSYEIGFFPDNIDHGNWSQVIGGFVDLAGMLFLKSGLWTLAHHMVDVNSEVPVFFYSFEFDSDDSLFAFTVEDGGQVPWLGGISHADDLLYLFNLPGYFNETETIMVDRMTALYANFAKYGDPTPPEESSDWSQWTPQWQPFSPHGKAFHLLDLPMRASEDFTTRWNYNKYGYPHRTQNP